MIENKIMQINKLAFDPIDIKETNKKTSNQKVTQKQG